MIKITVRNQAPQPPARFKKKLEEWNNANFDAVLTDGEIIGNPNYPDTFEAAGSSGEYRIPYQWLMDSKVCTFHGTLYLTAKPEIGKIFQSRYWNATINVTFTKEAA